MILNNNSNFHKKTDLLLYLAARNENFVSIINKEKEKKIILIDRFIDSTIAYQFNGMGINLKTILYINNFILGNLKPSHTFLNLVSIKNLKKRVSLRKKTNRYDKFNSSFYKRVQNGFLELSQKNKKKYTLINSNLDIKINKDLVLKKIERLIK